MTGKPEITAGEYTVDGRSYVARTTDDGRLRLHWVNGNGDVSRYVVARVADGVAEPTSNGRGHEAAIAAINADPAGTRVAAHCDDCHREITNPTSIKLRCGRTCAKKHRTAPGPPPSNPGTRPRAPRPPLCTPGTGPSAATTVRVDQ